MIFQIDESTPYPTFPDPRSGDEDGLFAVGGDLSIDRLLLAYCHGIFPWYSFRDQPDILWYCPMQRFVIFPEEIHVSHSMRTLINKDQYSYSINEAFDDVIAQCSKLRIEQDAWEDAVAEAKDKAENEQHVNFIYPDTAPFQEAMAPLHDSVLAANPELQPIYDLIQQHNAAHTAD